MRWPRINLTVFTREFFDTVLPLSDLRNNDISSLIPMPSFSYLHGLPLLEDDNNQFVEGEMFQTVETQRLNRRSPRTASFHAKVHSSSHY
jgi:hypothetical protein